MKLEKAKKYNLIILTEDEWLEMIGDFNESNSSQILLTLSHIMQTLPHIMLTLSAPNSFTFSLTNDEEIIDSVTEYPNFVT